MADIKSGRSTTTTTICNESCGCPSPCPGGISCRCRAGGEEIVEHKKCACGEHCGCNPCRCSKEEVKGTGKAFCKCAPGCPCVTCAS